VRASLGPYSCEGDVDALVQAITTYFAASSAHSFPTRAVPQGGVEVESLWVYPIKGARGLRLSGPWPVCSSGLLFDRLWCVTAADGASAGNPLGQKLCPGLAALQPVLVPSRGTLLLFHTTTGLSHEVPLTPPKDGKDQGSIAVRGKKRTGGGVVRYGAETSQWLSGVLGVPVHLVHRAPKDKDEGGSLANQSALLLVNTASVDDFQSHLAGRLDARRFRANVVVKGGAAWAEDQWGTLTLPSHPDCYLTLGEPCARCTQITISSEPPYVPALDGEPLLTLMKFRRIRGQAFFGTHTGVSGAPALAGRYSEALMAFVEAAKGNPNSDAELQEAGRTGVQPPVGEGVVRACAPLLRIAEGDVLAIGKDLREPPAFEVAPKAGKDGAGSSAAP